MGNPERAIDKSIRLQKEYDRRKRVLIAAVLGFFAFLAILIAVESGGKSDCYTKGDPGSAQYERDMQHCIKGDR